MVREQESDSANDTRVPASPRRSDDDLAPRGLGAIARVVNFGSPFPIIVDVLDRWSIVVWSDELRLRRRIPGTRTWR